jgi:hypothetical protein
MMTALEVTQGLGLNHLPTHTTQSTHNLASATKKQSTKIQRKKEKK